MGSGSTPDGVYHTVRQGETTESLAAEHRLFWETVWDHPNNEALKARRKRPNVLRPGDTLFIPRIEAHEYACETTKRHTFKLKGIPSLLKVQFTDFEGQPRAGEKYRLVCTGMDVSGTLDGDGWLKVPIHPGVRRAVVSLGEARSAEREYEARDDEDEARDDEDEALETHELLIGNLDPLDTLRGICDRLRNLDYYRGPSLDEPDIELERAIHRFREDQSLSEGTQVDDDLRDALEKAHHV